ncbi:glycoside hydrolase family protein [Cyclobacterium plantarum]|uniref:Glycosyl hydrolase family 32 N-terminal domain-containing protein n=1 Tax=Cyclobacterium plantarum TaxID=2716263 RepID=A0ABX0H3E2_9BACT|nr:hypothetical protein [Cyclobacterium plantarum]NHE56323.1 hypothetical protein [Cyclobacterium plantarum]
MKKRNQITRTSSKITSRRNFLKNSVFCGTFGLVSGSGLSPLLTKNTSPGIANKKLRPILDENWWLIGPPPLKGSHNIPVKIGLNGEIRTYESVDHHIFRADDGYWHLWGCVRHTGWGRILYHWKSKNLTDSPWEDTGEFIRANAAFGESINGWDKEEWIQSPFIVKEKGLYYMFYGGHSTGRNKEGIPARGNSRNESFDTECQICIMTSKDGLKWNRYTFDDGLSRAFSGPGEARDPCLIKIDGLWHLYYTGLEDGDPQKGGMFVRTSRDLLHWSDYQLVHRAHQYGRNWWEIECPHVVYREGYFYLFRTQNYVKAITHVFRSEDPLDFGKGNEAAAQKYVGQIPCAAPEIYQLAGEEYLSSNHDPALGTQMCRLHWETET